LTNLQVAATVRNSYADELKPGGKMRRIAATLLLIVLAMPLLAAAQQDHDGAPKVLIVRREDVKPGQSIAHEKFESVRRQALQRINSQAPTLALVSMSGPDEVWFTSGYDSFEKMEKHNEAMEGSAAYRQIQQQYTKQESGFVSSVGTMICVLSPEMSYKPDFSLAGSRYFRVRITRVRTGHESEYRELRKLINTDEYEKTGRDISVTVYHVTNGAPAGTYVTFFPMKSAAEWDRPGPAMRQFLGSDYEKVVELMDKSVLGYEDTLFRINRQMTLPSKQWVTADPGFWSGVARDSPRNKERGAQRGGMNNKK
jgi:hypothetical protein